MRESKMRDYSYQAVPIIVLIGAYCSSSVAAPERPERSSVEVKLFEDFSKEDKEAGNIIDLFVEEKSPVLGPRAHLLPDKWNVGGGKEKRVLIRLNIEYPEAVTVKKLQTAIEEIKTKIVTEKPVVISVVAYAARPK
jgi:hypothetical protein